MLPDVSKRRKLWGWERKQYDGHQIHEIIRARPNDGVTTRNCDAIVRRMNEYLEDSRYLIIEASVVFYFMKDLSGPEYDGSDCRILRLYAEKVGTRIPAVSMGNLMRIAKSVASQRQLLKSVKSVVKVNRIPGDWEALLGDFLGGLEGRVNYLRDVVIPENVADTPMWAYGNHIASTGSDVCKDIRLFVANNGTIFGGDDDGVLEYKAHVLDVLRGLDGETERAVLEKAAAALDARNRRIEKAREEREAMEAKKAAAAMEECRSEVLALCSTAGKRFRAERLPSLRRLSKSVPDAWVVAAAVAAGGRHGYLKRSGSGRFSVSAVSRASVFKTEAEAVAAARSFCGRGGGRVAEVARVELLEFGIGF